jgi:hypothetical protein
LLAQHQRGISPEQPASPIRCDADRKSGHAPSAKRFRRSRRHQPWEPFVSLLNTSAFAAFTGTADAAAKAASRSTWRREGDVSILASSSDLAGTRLPGAHGSIFRMNRSKSPIKPVKSKNSVGPFRRRTAESKSAEYANKINGVSESSSSVHPLTALANFSRSERRPQPGENEGRISAHRHVFRANDPRRQTFGDTRLHRAPARDLSLQGSFRLSESASSRCSSTKPAWRAQLSTASICGRTATRCLPTHANGKALVYSGKVGTGWSRTVSGQIRKKLDPVVIHTSKLTNPIRDPNAT